MQQTFTDFKNDFYKRLPDLTLFDCGEINLLKVVLDGLKVNYVSKGKVRSYLFYNLYVLKLIRFIKSINTKPIEIPNNNFSFLIFDTNRTIVDEFNTVQSVYFKNIIQFLLKENCFVIKNQKSKVINYDTTEQTIYNNYQFNALDKFQLSLINNIKQTYYKIKQSNIFNEQELKNIQFAFHKFFNDFVVYDIFLSNHRTFKKALFTAHYHKEGIIYALKKHKIKCIELQHGLIAKEDIFYVFPEKILKTKKDLLFADFIGVYGDYWKNKLLQGYEYSRNKIFIIGCYQYEPVVKNNEYDKVLSLSKNNYCLLVTTQTFLHKEYINFINELNTKLNKQYSNYYIIVKPHPNENIELYSSAFKPDEKIIISTLPISTLFQIIKINISSYSTTLFDALKYNVFNYVFKLPQTIDYVNTILEDKIAVEINFEKNISLNSLNNNINFKNFYDEENLKQLHTI